MCYSHPCQLRTTVGKNHFPLKFSIIKITLAGRRNNWQIFLLYFMTTTKFPLLFMKRKDSEVSSKAEHNANISSERGGDRI